jgi:hypothetical protein
MISILSSDRSDNRMMQGTQWRNANTVLAIVGLITSIAIFYATRNYPKAPLEFGGSPGFYPRVLAVFLGGLSVAVLIEGLIRPLRVSFPKGRNLLRLLFAIGLLALAPIMLVWLGFRLMGVLIAFGTVVLLSDWQELTPKAFILFAVIAVVSSYALFFIFENVARVPLPRGRLF